MVTKKPKHILIAPLDWGLGHTTRCIPLIEYLSGQGHKVIVAGNEAQRSYLEQSCVQAELIHLEGYNITYSKWNKWAQMGLMTQAPDVLKAIKAEHRWLEKLCKERKIDGIISDNRYGLHHDTIPNVIITHQLQIKTGMGLVADRSVQKIHYSLLNRFGAIWVADVEGRENLAGTLAHTTPLPAHTSYIGWLSRFANNILPEKSNEITGPVLFLISGPEPARSELSSLLWHEALKYKGEVIFAEGSDLAKNPEIVPPHITYHKRLSGEMAGQAIKSAGLVICRSGYSTIMDLVALQKKAILIPTPGQTEQEYLGHLLHDKGIFFSVMQNNFNLGKAINSVRKFPFHSLAKEGSFSLFRQVADKWINSL